MKSLLIWRVYLASERTATTIAIEVGRFAVGHSAALGVAVVEALDGELGVCYGRDGPPYLPCAASPVSSLEM